MNNMYINIGVNNGSEKGTKKTQHLLSRLSWLPCPGNQLSWQTVRRQQEPLKHWYIYMRLYGDTSRSW